MSIVLKKNENRIQVYVVENVWVFYKYIYEICYGLCANYFQGHEIFFKSL